MDMNETVGGDCGQYTLLSCYKHRSMFGEKDIQCGQETSSAALQGPQGSHLGPGPEIKDRLGIRNSPKLGEDFNPSIINQAERGPRWPCISWTAF